MNIDWQQVCLNLRRHKHLAKVARLVECDEATLNRIARGETKSVKFETGLKLLDLHFDLCPERHKKILSCFYSET